MSQEAIQWEKYDGVELASCIYLHRHTPDEHIDRLDDDEGETPHMHSLYLHCIEGGVECFADFPATAAGAQMARLLARHLVVEQPGFSAGITDLLVENY